MKWNIHIYDPKSQTTTTHVKAYPGTSSMADAPAVVAKASRDFKKHMKYILAVPNRGDKQQHATIKVPDSGYLIAPHGGNYVQAFRTGRGALGDSDALTKARRAAKALAEKSRIAVDITRVGARGEDRYLVEEIYPQAWGQKPYVAQQHATKRKAPAQLDREIGEVIGHWEEDRFGGHRFVTTRDGIRFDTAGVDSTFYRDPKWQKRWESDLRREIEKFQAGKPTKLYKMSDTHYRLPGTV